MLPTQPCHLPFPVRRILQSCLALCPDLGLPNRISLGQTTFLHYHRGPRRTVIVVRSFSGTMRLSDLPLLYIPGAPWGYPGRTSVIHSEASCGISSPRRRLYEPEAGSRVRCFRTCTRSSTAQGPHISRANDMPGIAFRSVPQRRHPDI